MARHDDALLRQVVDDLESDEPRAVLADALEAEGDPRGELIALQLAAARDPNNPALRERIDQILRRHGRAWLGELAPVILRAQYQRGFLTRVELAGGPVTDPQVGDPRLATVEELVPGRASGEVYARFLMAPALVSLRRVEVWDAATLAALAATPAPVAHVACAWWKRGAYVEQLRTAVLPACRRFIGLRSLGIAAEGFTALAGDPVFAQLHMLTVGGRLEHALPLWPRLAPGIASLVIARSAGLDERDGTGRLAIRRNGDRVVARVEGDAMLGRLVDAFGLLPRLDRLEVEAGNHEALVARARRAKVPIAIIGAARRSGYITGG